MASIVPSRRPNTSQQSSFAAPPSVVWPLFLAQHDRDVAVAPIHPVTVETQERKIGPLGELGVLHREGWLLKELRAYCLLLC